MSHCNQGEYFRSCKYDDEDCPACEGMLPEPDREYVIKTLVWMADQMEQQRPEYTNNIYRQAIILIDYNGQYHDY
jgi:hypothetical protein